MQRAASAAADTASRIAAEKKDILVLAGPGKNGGDARIVAQLLEQRFFRVHVVSGGDEIPQATWGLIVDGLFGIGLSREIAGEYAALVDYANRQRCPVLALDIPSGIHSDSGRVLGRAVRASHTVTFIALKPGLLTLDGPDYCGELQVADLGLDVQRIVSASAWPASPELFKSFLKARPRNFHKGMAGSVAVLGGASGMAGAALLAGRAALKMGAGRVYAGLLDESLSIDLHNVELMLRHPDDALGQDLDAIVVGPGLGVGERAQTLVGAALASDLPCVVDADALNLISENEDLRHACARRSADTLLTPHPAEAGRLLAISTADVQADRVKAAKILATNLNAHVVLKGAGSILVARDGHWFVNTSGNAGMASAGMGDVLAGVLGALLAQRYSGESALVLGVHLHGTAADDLVAAGVGPVGLTAGETIEAARRRWNAWLRDETP
jgi:ADP-dependent NAD(P)H-hydrate dehydratase / NAD(P)H-hydrate epimerase